VPKQRRHRPLGGEGRAKPAGRGRLRILVASCALLVVLTVGAMATCAVVKRGSASRTAAPSSFSGEDAFSQLRDIVQLQRWYGASGRDHALDVLEEHLRANVDTVERQSLQKLEPVSGKTFTLTNLVARQNPRAKRRLLFGSHWDSRLWAEEDPDPTQRDRPIAGANDSGSGVAVLLALAKHTRGLASIGIDYVLFDGEEFGRPQGGAPYCQGSSYFVRTIETFYPVVRPEAVVILDMVGDRDLNLYWEVSSLRRAPELTRELWAAASALGLRGWYPQTRHHIIDDQTPFQELGIPAVLIIDYDYPPWHTQSDTIDKVSPASLGGVGAVLLKLARDRDARGAGR
jgi:glutaminyl-peptide cyclotransferase